jgi:hypothetical protein
MNRFIPSILAVFLLCCSCDEFRALPSDTRLDAGDWEEGEEQTVDEPEEKYSYVEVSGHYVKGFECSCFYPCDSDEMWWVIPGDELTEKYGTVLPLRDRHKEEGRLYVRLSGMVSELGSYGHMGGGDRRFEVQRVYEIRLSADSDCN